jgi:hypothetical protein
MLGDRAFVGEAIGPIRALCRLGTTYQSEGGVDGN